MLISGLSFKPVTEPKKYFIKEHSMFFLNRPVKCDGAETEHGGRAEEFMQELEGLAEYRRVKPPAAARAGAQGNVEGDAHQAGTDS